MGRGGAQADRCCKRAVDDGSTGEHSYDAMYCLRRCLHGHLIHVYSTVATCIYTTIPVHCKAGSRRQWLTSGEPSDPGQESLQGLRPLTLKARACRTASSALPLTPAQRAFHSHAMAATQRSRAIGRDTHLDPVVHARCLLCHLSSLYPHPKLIISIRSDPSQPSIRPRQRAHVPSSVSSTCTPSLARQSTLSTNDDSP